MSSILTTRRKFLLSALGTAAGGLGAYAGIKIADSYGWLAPNHANIRGAGDALTYAAQRLLTSHGSMAREFGKGDLSTVTPVNHGFPRYDPYLRLLYNGFADWRLYVDGLVTRPTAFSLSALKRLPSKTQITQLNCEEGWSYIAGWTGVQLSLILNMVGARPEARWVVFYPFNDFWGSIDMPEAMHPQTLLAYGMNGNDLEPGHGAPIRLRVPRQLGYKNLKYIARISVTDSLENVGDGNGSAAPSIGYAWYGGI